MDEEKVPENEECSDELLENMLIATSGLMKGGSVYFAQMYGEQKVLGATMVGILKQLSILSVAYPGLDLDFISGLQEVNSEIRTLHLMRGFYELDKIISLLYLWERKNQEHFPVDNDSQELAYKQMKGDTLKAHKLDFTYTGSRCQFAKTPGSKHECKELAFFPVEKPGDMRELENQLAMMTTLSASSSVLGLFAAKGPSPPMKEELLVERTSLCQNLFCQPAFNPRFSVQTGRLLEILDTCRGTKPANNLISHGVGVFPYCSKSTCTHTPNRVKKIDEQVEGANEVKSSYINTVGKAELYGRPVAENLKSAEVANLWLKLMGCEITTVLLTSPEVNQAVVWLPDRFKALLYLSFLLERLEVEYNGFRSLSDWKKLNWRLRKVYGPVCEGLAVPRTAPNLIYNTMILFQGLSSVRLCFLEGQGRHLAAVHSLLELSAEYSNPKQRYNKEYVVHQSREPLMNYDIVGATNTKVEVYDLGLQDLTGTFAYDTYSAWGEAIQKKTETVCRMNITVVMLNYCLKVTVHKVSSYASTFKHPELAIPLRERTQSWYTAVRFEDFMMGSIKEAIRYLQECMVDGIESPVGRMVNKYLRQMRNTGQTTVASDSEKKSEWFSHKLLPNFKRGFSSQNSNIQCPEAVVLVTILSHCFYWLPKHDIASELSQFLQTGGGGEATYKTKTKTHFFPNPDAGNWKLNKEGGCDFPVGKQLETRFIEVEDRQVS